jgi:type IV pilus assembly protein PilB
MGMPISGLLKALIHDDIINPQDAMQLSENAAASNTDIADYIFQNTHYDHEEIKKSCARYFNFPITTCDKIKNPHLEGSIIYYKQNDKPLAAIYRPHDIAHTSTPVNFISAQEYFSIRQSIRQPAHDNDKTAIEKLNNLIHTALINNASDIHLEPFHNDYHVRYRIHGLLSHKGKLSHTLTTHLITRLKVLAKADITQTRLPQDAHFSYANNNHHCDCRISFCPTIWGEKVVIRLLDSNKHIFQIKELGLTSQQHDTLLNSLQSLQGLILLTGPTGSGKTQSLYSIINYLNKPNLNISTVEDPVEIKMSGINQIHIDNDIGLNYANVLRALLRQDPDIIMIGEIRDRETAELAIEAAHTGHLVLATLHTQSTLEAISRLKHLGVATFNLSSSLSLIIAQRLLRQYKNNTVCGRTAIFEFLHITPKIKQLIDNNASISEIKTCAQQTGFISLYESGLTKVKSNITTLSELKRFVLPDQEHSHENS